MGRLLVGAWLVVAALVVGAGCYNPRLQAEIYSGHQLTLGLGTAQQTDQIIFRQGGEVKVVRPSAGKTLVAVPLTVQNNKAGTALLLVNEDAALLRDTSFRNYPPIDPFGQAVPLGEPSDESLEAEGRFVPFLWGAYELEKDFRLTGWLIFETPSSRQWEALDWRQGDTIIAYFHS